MDSATLNNLHAEWYKSPCDSSLSALLSGVRDVALRAGGEFGDAAQDFAQNVTIRVYQHLGTFTPFSADAFSKWLAVIIKNERRHQFDAKAKEHISSEGMSEEPTEDHAPYVDISRLPESLYVIALSIISGHTLKETAAALGVKEGTLRERLRAYRSSCRNDQSSSACKESAAAV